MTTGERYAVEELAAALGQPVKGEKVPADAEAALVGVCEFFEDEDGNYDVTCHAVTIDVECFLHYDAAMAYLQALGVRDET